MAMDTYVCEGQLIFGQLRHFWKIAVMMKFLVASTLVGVAAAASHTATPYAVADGKWSF
jgi:hypothetical protein